jgi:F0F1-type ATP synthase membrane subunit c/vacuolar-type H+-ATPase subunit K
MYNDPTFNKVFSNLLVAESGNKHRNKDGSLVTSPVGAQGVTQLMPMTRKNPGYGVRPAQNDSQEEYIRVGKEYLAAMYNLFGGDWAKAAAAYNAGPGNVHKAINRAAKSGKGWMEHLPKPSETVPYVNKLLAGTNTSAGSSNIIKTSLKGGNSSQHGERHTVFGGKPDIPTKPYSVFGDEGKQPAQPYSVFGDAVSPSPASDVFGEGKAVAPVPAPKGVVGRDYIVLEDGTPVPGFGSIRQNIDHKTLYTDPSWLDASDKMYRTMEGLDPKENFKSDEDLAKWGLQYITDVDKNLIITGLTTAKIFRITDPEAKAALLYMMDTYDNVNTSWAGAWRSLKAFGTDATNLIGLGTFGIGTVGKQILAQGGKQVAKATLRQAIKKSLGRAGVIAGLEGMVSAGVENTIRQNLEINIGKREEFSHLELGAASGLGGFASATLGTVFDMAAGKIVRSLKENPSASKLFNRKATGKAAAGEVGGEAGEAAGRNADGILTKLKGTAGDTADNATGDVKITKLKGRRPEDDTLTGPILDGGNETKILRDSGFDLQNIKTGLRNTPQTVDEARATASLLSEQLKGTSKGEIEAIVEAMRRSELTGEEMGNLAVAVQMAADDMKVERAKLIFELDTGKLKGEALEASLTKLSDIESKIVPIEMADEAFSSQQGSALAKRKGGLTDLRGISVETIKQQNPQLTDLQARWEYVKVVAKALQEKTATETRQEFAPEIERLLDADDWDGAMRLLGEREEAVAKAIDDTVPLEMREMLKGDSNLEHLGSDYKSGFFDKLNELSISNVFSTTTLMINSAGSGIKTFIQPVIDAIVSNPLEKATRIEMVGHYSAMVSSFRGAVRAAKAAFNYEQALLTNDTARLMEGQLAIAGKKGGMIRVIPRMLNATDEFLSRMAYNGYVGGKATAEAYVDAVAKGMNPEKAMKFAKEQAEIALKNAYEQHNIEVRLKPIVNKAKSLGLEGKELDAWVIAEAKKSLKDIQHGTNEAGKDYVEDILYKRKFTGEWGVEKLGQSAEHFFLRHPGAKWLTGQLFLRTPIRVVEEGLKLTPGVQMLMPNFRNDLLGLNGVARQAKAQGQTMVAMMIANYAIYKYATGESVGAGPSDYRQKRLKQDSGQPEAYTIKDDEGDTWSYRSFDPIAIPMKIITTSLEQMDKLKIREAQGEFIGEDSYKKVSAQISAALMPIILAVSDANLFSGITKTVKLLSGLENLEEDHNAFYKYFGERVRWLLPNTLHKLYRTSDTSLRDPVTLGQTVATQLGPLAPLIEQSAGIRTSKSYDILGHERTVTDVGAMWNTFSQATPEERNKGRSEKELAVLKEMDRLAMVAGQQAIFTGGYKHESLGSLDLRTVLTKDGTMTLYDKWNQKYREMNPAEVLYPIAVASLPDGTHEYKGMKIKELQSQIRGLREVAFYSMMAEEESVIKKMQQEFFKKQTAEAGLFDYGRKQPAPQLPQ